MVGESHLTLLLLCIFQIFIRISPCDHCVVSAESHSDRVLQSLILQTCLNIIRLDLPKYYYQCTGTFATVSMKSNSTKCFLPIKVLLVRNKCPYNVFTICCIYRILYLQYIIHALRNRVGLR